MSSKPIERIWEHRPGENPYRHRCFRAFCESNGSIRAAIIHFGLEPTPSQRAKWMGWSRDDDWRKRRDAKIKYYARLEDDHISSMRIRARTRILELGLEALEDFDKPDVRSGDAKRAAALIKDEARITRILSELPEASRAAEADRMARDFLGMSDETKPLPPPKED